MKSNVPEPFTIDFFASVERRAQTSPGDIALQCISPASRDAYSWRQFVDEARSVSAMLISCGLKPDDRVAILIENHPLWGIAFAGIQSAGGIVVPLDTMSSVATLAGVVAHAEARFLIASQQFSEAARQIRAQAVCLEHSFGDVDWKSMPPPEQALPHVPRSLDDNLAILYTGGTTGKPKGVLLTQRGLYRSITDMLEVFTLSPRDRVLSILPLFHIMPLLANLLAPLYTGAQVIFLAQIDATQVLRAFLDEGITAFLCVPQFYYQMQRRILDEVARQPRLKQWMFRRMLSISGFLRSHFGIRIGKRVFSPIHARFGNQLRAFGVGGASFSLPAARFFADLGFQLFQAYGLTECSGLATATPLDREGGFTCGKPVAHTEVRIANPDADGIGEITIRGENVMRGYWRDPDATSDIVRDAWLHTGDLGTFDAVGALRLTGRAKEVIVLSSGKNIFPEEIEECLRSQCLLVREVCIVGIEETGATRLHCLVVPDYAAFRDQQSSFVERHIRAEIETASRSLPAYKRPTSLQIINEPLPRTTTRKLQRFKAAALARTNSSENGTTPVHHRESDDPIEREIIALIRRVHQSAGPIETNSSLELDVHVDSLERVELIANLERTFRIAIDERQAADLFTVADIIALVKSGAARSSGDSTTEPRDGWRDSKSILLEPLTEAEHKFAEQYLRPRPIAERFWFAVACVFRLAAKLFLRLRVDAPQELPSGGFLLCPNHASYLDDALVSCVLPFSTFRRVFVLGASKYFRNPLLAWLGRYFRVIPVDTDKHLLHALRIGRAGIEKGMVLCVFPEGTRSFDGKLQKLMRGPAVLAEAISAPVVPMGIAGAFEVLPRAGGFGGLHPVGVSLGVPVRAADSETADDFNCRLSRQLELQIRKASDLHA